MLEPYQIWTFKSCWGKCRRLRFTTSGTRTRANGKPRGRLERSCCPKTWLNLLISPRVSWTDKYRQIQWMVEHHTFWRQWRDLFLLRFIHFFYQQKTDLQYLPVIETAEVPFVFISSKRAPAMGSKRCFLYRNGYLKYQDWTWDMASHGPPYAKSRQSELFQTSRDHLEIIELNISTKALCQCAPRGVWWGFTEMLWAGFVGLVQCSLDVLCRFQWGACFFSLDGNEWKNTPGPSQK